MPSRQHRLVFPAIGLEREVAAIVLAQPVDDQLHAQPFLEHVPRRRNEQPQARGHRRGTCCAPGLYPSLRRALATKPSTGSVMLERFNSAGTLNPSRPRTQASEQLGLPDSFSVSSLSKGLRIGNFRRLASASPPISRERPRERMWCPDFFRFRRDGRCVGVFLTGEDLEGFQFGFVCFQGFAGRKSFAPSQPAPRSRRLDRCVAPAKASIQETARCRDVGPRGACSSRGLGNLRETPLGRWTPKRARRAAAGFRGEHGHCGFSSSEVGGRE